ncbi:MAG: hypothetical protein ACK56I_21190, partial [bacterium]
VHLQHVGVGVGDDVVLVVADVRRAEGGVLGLVGEDVLQQLAREEDLRGDEGVAAHPDLQVDVHRAAAVPAREAGVEGDLAVAVGGLHAAEPATRPRIGVAAGAHLGGVFARVQAL